MSVRTVAFMALSAAMGGGLGCASAPKDVRLDQTANGQRARVAVGGRLALTLPSNVTTGYQWTLTEPAAAILEKTGHKYEPPASSLMGAGGKEVWEFKGIAAGEGTLRLEYRRPWEPKTVDPGGTFQVAVTVTSASP